jgi:hypothetical protein
MTNSELLAEKVLDTIIDLLNEKRISSEVDEPIDDAAQGFRLEVTTPISHAGFNQVMATFVQNIYRRALRLQRYLSEQEAFTEAVFLLESYYEGAYTKGYDGALLDATGSNLEGLELVLSRLAESIKVAERVKYVEWVFADNVYHLDWKTRYRIVAVHLKRNEEFLSAGLYDSDPARFVDHLHDLIMNYLSTDSLIRHIFNGER